MKSLLSFPGAQAKPLLIVHNKVCGSSACMRQEQRGLAAQHADHGLELPM